MPCIPHLPEIKVMHKTNKPTHDKNNFFKSIISLHPGENFKNMSGFGGNDAKALLLKFHFFLSFWV